MTTGSTRYFFKTDSGVVFNDVFGGLIDVSALTGHELGCFADPGNLLAWDMITTVSELAKSVGGRYMDMPINVGCVNPSKVSGSRLSLFSINLEPVWTTFGPTIKSSKAKVTVNNDAVFARMVQSLWKDIGEVRSQYACKQSDPSPAGGVPPLSSALCKKLASLWSHADLKIKLCVNATFSPPDRLLVRHLRRTRANLIDELRGCDSGRGVRSRTSYNRLGELRSRVEVFQHVWDERFLNSLKPAGFCRENGTCPP